MCMHILGPSHSISQISIFITSSGFKWSLPLRSSNQNSICTPHSLWAWACPTELICRSPFPNLRCSSFYGEYLFDLCFCLHILELFNVSSNRPQVIPPLYCDLPFWIITRWCKKQFLFLAHVIVKAKLLLMYSVCPQLTFEQPPDWFL